MNKLVWRSAIAGGAVALAFLALQTRHALRATPAVPPSSVMTVISADVEHPNEQALVAGAQLILVGTPIDAGQAVSKNESPLFADYYQTIQVEQVLKGTDQGATIQTVRAGIVRADHSQVVKDPDELAGPLAQERQILFLGPSADPGVFAVIGHTSGAMALGNDGRVAKTRPELKAFEGLDIAAVHARIRELEAHK